MKYYLGKYIAQTDVPSTALLGITTSYTIQGICTSLCYKLLFKTNFTLNGTMNRNITDLNSHLGFFLGVSSEFIDVLKNSRIFK
jgi:hypothetical protein